MNMKCNQQSFFKTRCLPFLVFYFPAVFLFAAPPVKTHQFADLSAKSMMSKFVQKKYQKDAVRLALRLSSENKNYHALDIQVSTKLVNSIYDALVAIHQSNLPDAQMVTRLHKLHTFPEPTVDRFFLVYEKKVDWAKPLRLGETITDSKKINALLEKYGLVIDTNKEWDEEHNSIHIRAKEPLNIARLVEDFKKVEGVVKVDLLQPDGDGNDIEVKSTDAGWMINYVLKFDTCIHECKKKHYWSFEVNHTGDVIFLGEFGDELPEWMREDSRQLAEGR